MANSLEDGRKRPSADLTKHQFRVCRDFVDGKQETTAHGLTPKAAAVEFLRCSNNVSAHAGLIERVTIQDELGAIYIQWLQGRGYTEDGEHYRSSPYEM
jgi:hypothetical protein